MARHVDNIGERGARHRRRGGWMWAAVAVLVAIVLATTHASRPTRLLLALPVGLAAVGFLQAREKT
jgi:uncharacterized membrane protein HdeD (DUF308 family)